MLEMRELASLRAVITEGSFELAARALFVTPGAMSQRIKQLEEKVGQVLVLRTSPPTLTSAGESVLQLAHQVALLQQEALETIQHGTTAEPRSLVIAVNHDSMATWFMPSVTGYAQRKKLQLDLRVHEREQTHRLLRQGVAVAAVTSELVPVQGCKVKALGALRYVAVAAPDFAEEWFPDGVLGKMSARAPLVAFDRADSLAQLFIRRTTRKRVSPPVHYVPASADLVRATVMRLGWSVVPMLAVKPLLDEGTLVRLEERSTLDVPLYWQTWNLKSALLMELEDEVTKTAVGLLEELH